MNILTGEFALFTSFIFETWIQDELIVRIFGQEHLRLYIVWLCQIQSVLWHDIEVKRFLLTTLIDDEILYFVGFSYRILAIIILCDFGIVVGVSSGYLPSLSHCTNPNIGLSVWRIQGLPLVSISLSVIIGPRFGKP